MSARVGDNPYEAAGGRTFDGVQDHAFQRAGVDAGAGPAGDAPDSPNGNPETFDYLRRQEAGHVDWFRLCLGLQRQARGLPPVFPSAIVAANAVPRGERVAKLGKLGRGMAGYWAVGEFGHVAAVVRARGATPTQVPILGSDAPLPHLVGRVSAEWFAEHWGARFLFGAYSLNGFDLRHPPKVKPGTRELLDALDAGLAALRHADAIAERRDFPAVERAVELDIERMSKRRDALAAQLPGGKP